MLENTSGVFPYTTLFRSLLGCLALNWDRLEPHAKVVAANPDNVWRHRGEVDAWWVSQAVSVVWLANGRGRPAPPDRKSIRLNSSHSSISYAVIFLKKKIG